ncbi:MAG: AAA family ATPase [Candidatus Ozemobacteraceae bacterium]
MEASMKPISTSTSTFRTLRDGGYVYVDKTALLHRLVAPFQGVFFFPRPRRFGKSLTISTFEEI